MVVLLQLKLLLNAEFAPELRGLRYGEEIWALYENGDLHAEVTLTGAFEDPDGPADIDAVLAEIQATVEEEEARRGGAAADEAENSEPPPPWLEG